MIGEKGIKWLEEIFCKTKSSYEKRFCKQITLNKIKIVDIGSCSVLFFYWFENKF